MKISQLELLLKGIIKEALSNKSIDEMVDERNPHQKTKDQIYSILSRSGFYKEGNTPREYMEYYLNGFATVFCMVDLGSNKILIQRYYDSERLDTMPGYHIEKSVPLPPQYDEPLVKKVVAVCERLQRSVKGDESIMGGIDDIQEGEEADAVNSMWDGSDDDLETHEAEPKSWGGGMLKAAKKQTSKKFFSGSNKPKKKTVQDFDWDAIKRGVNKWTLKENDIPLELSTQNLLRRISKAQKARGIPPIDTSKMSYVDLQKYYNSIEQFDDSVYVPGHGWGGVKENDGETKSNPIDGKSNVSAAATVNKVLSELSKGIFSDQSWEAINRIFEKLTKLGMEVTILSTKYGGQTANSSMPTYKEWRISIPFTNKVGKPMELVGPVTAHGAGSIEQPLDRYDVTAYVSAIPARN